MWKLKKIVLKGQVEPLHTLPDPLKYPDLY